MFDRFRYRHMLAAVAAVRAERAGAAHHDAWVVGSPTLARLLMAQPMAGLTVRGEATAAQLGAAQPAASLVDVVIAVGELGDVAAVSRALVRGGTLLWFSAAPAHVAAGRALAAGHDNIWQRAAGRQLLTVSTKLALAAGTTLPPVAS